MANQEHLEILRQGLDVWNQWRRENPDLEPDLSSVDFNAANLYNIDFSNVDFSASDLSLIDLIEANLSRANLSNANLNDANLEKVDLTEAILKGADLSRAKLCNVNFSRAILVKAIMCNAELDGANLSNANLSGANLNDANLSGADLSNADLSEADLREANFTSAKLIDADLSEADLRGTRFVNADLSRANLTAAKLIETKLNQATLTNCLIYGISAWNIQVEDAKQMGLIITLSDEPTITVDNLEVAQFIYLLLNNQKIRDVINTIGQKGVLILGRFSQERKLVLDALREKLRTLNFLPIVFDFERSTERDFTETIMTLAGLSCFIIADITNPKSCPLELQATVPNYMIPFVPLIHEGEQPFSMFQDLKGKYNWVLDTLVYDTPYHLVKGLERAVVEPALEKRAELLAKKVEQLRTRHIRDYL